MTCLNTMATPVPHNCQACEAEPNQPPFVVQDMVSINQVADSTEQDYDFVEQPDQDCYCPVSLELLINPYLTSCCGHHISQQAVNRLVREGKPCPMCKDENFTTQVNKYFKRRMINTLKVRCLHKKSGCDWVGELGDLDLHSTSCPKRPWKCQHCDFESTYEVGINNHTPNCTKYPQPCPNQCEIGSVPRCDLEKHLLVCPLQLVECEFAHSGCDVKVPQRDLTKHMTESAQHHIMSATLLNLRLTRELHQKMEEKDQQIVDLQQQVKQLDREMKQQSVDLDTKLQKQTVELDTKLQKQTTDLKHEQRAEFVQHFSTLTKLIEQTSRGFSCRVFTLTEFNKYQAKGEYGSWYSDPFYESPGGYRFLLNIDTNGAGSALGTHLSAYLYLLPGDYDKELKWPIKVTVHLEILNQQGDYRHHTVVGIIKYREATIAKEYRLIGPTEKFFPLAKLGYNAFQKTAYSENNNLKFRLMLKVLN